MELYSSITDAILFVEKPALWMFRAIGDFLGFFQLLKAPDVFDSCAAIDNLELVGLTLQLGALWQAHWIPRNGWRWSLGALKKFDYMV